MTDEQHQREVDALARAFVGVLGLDPVAGADRPPGHDASWCRCVHTPFTWCDCCNLPGPCYYGDRCADMQPRRGMTRADALESVLEAIETQYGPGDTFSTYELRSRVWWSQQRNVLRWLDHIGMLVRVPAPRNTLSYWHIPKGSTDDDDRSAHADPATA